MKVCTIDFVQCMRGSDQNLFGGAAAVRAGPSQITFFDHRNRQAGVTGRRRHAHSGIATAEDEHVVMLVAHRFLPSVREASSTDASHKTPDGRIEPLLSALFKTANRTGRP
jgi:hypothetical protein